MEGSTWVLFGYMAAMIIFIIWIFVYLRMKGYGFVGYKGR